MQLVVWSGVRWLFCSTCSRGMVLTSSWISARWLFCPLLQQHSGLQRFLVLVCVQEFRQYLLSKSVYICGSRERSKLFWQYRLPCLLDVFCTVCEPGNETITLSESMYRKKIFVGSPNHKNIFTWKFYNIKISRSTVICNWYYQFWPSMYKTVDFQCDSCKILVTSCSPL